MSRRNAAITLTIVGLVMSGCGQAGECEDCLVDHSGAPDAGAGTDEPDEPTDPGDGPSIAVVATRVRDERADDITFTADGAPRAFEHNGPTVELGGDGCPIVHKHALLLRSDHGGASETPANPVELKFRVTSDALDPDGGAYRVRAASGDALTDWIQAAGADGLFTAALDRDAVPDLVTARGPFEIEMRGRDLDGREVTATRCVDLRPIAGPIHVGQPQAMPRFSLMYRDPVSRLLNGNAAWPLIEVAIENGTPDAVVAQLQRSAVTAACSKRWQRWNVLTAITTGTQSCETDATLCTAPDLDPVIDHDDPVGCSPVIAPSYARFDLAVEIDGTAVQECAGCQPGEYRLPAHSAARVRLVAIDVPGLQPREASEPEEAYADQEVSYRTTTAGAGACPGGDDCAAMFVTGKATTHSGCMKSTIINGQLFCSERRTYKTVRALTGVSATFEQLSIDVTGVSLRAGGEQNEPTGYGGSRALDGYVWSTSAGSNVPDA